MWEVLGLDLGSVSRDVDTGFVIFRISSGKWAYYILKLAMLTVSIDLPLIAVEEANDMTQQIIS
jgi:hypothetical protein